uniref:Uncharacterized protein n=1 Tax=Steinernema glaseri TaxID=37863 RepID=A0A1I7YYX7_9BILA
MCVMMYAGSLFYYVYMFTECISVQVAKISTSTGYFFFFLIILMTFLNRPRASRGRSGAGFGAGVEGAVGAVVGAAEVETAVLGPAEEAMRVEAIEAMRAAPTGNQCPLIIQGAGVAPSTSEMGLIAGGGGGGGGAGNVAGGFWEVFRAGLVGGLVISGHRWRLAVCAQ